MSLKKYILRKEALKNPKEPLKIQTSKIIEEGKILPPIDSTSPTRINLKSKRLFKSVQNFTNLRKSENKSVCLRTLINLPQRNTLKRKTFHVNLRYLTESINDCEDVNKIETPSESFICNDNFLAEKINLEYQKYIKNEVECMDERNCWKMDLMTPDNRRSSMRKCRDVARIHNGENNNADWRNRKIL